MYAEWNQRPQVPRKTALCEGRGDGGVKKGGAEWGGEGEGRGGNEYGQEEKNRDDP